ncbi:aldose epimerase family protein [Bifidobacterium catulorum]|uniref:Aldose 1-epimerase n=1 Tax=Bifidobacterium catulorum TaxID=1630173 RepID=A0A2U2MR59_9BIFI|nr:aldose epimerase family protein [Bifidobacterium catulorum]PWG59332.1 galactose-1-epimerase [Bifidobacterium catulorum]
MTHHHKTTTSTADDDIQTVSITGPDGMTARLTNHGARLMSLTIPDRNGRMTDVVLGKDDPHDYLADDTLMGAIVGRNANRIRGARFAINGCEYHLAATEGGNNNHSQPNGYEHRNWTVRDVSESCVEFALASPDMDQGFPGRFRVHVRYVLTGRGLRLTVRGVVDKTTVANLTTHTYWNLDGEGNGDILTHRLRIPATRFYPTDEQFIPLSGPAQPVTGTAMDFRDSKTIEFTMKSELPAHGSQLAIARGYNHAFPIDGYDAALPECRLMAQVQGAHSGIRMSVYANTPTVLLYTAGFLDGIDGKHGHRYGPASGLCLEPGFVPDAMNRTDCPRPLLQAGDRYRLDIIYRFAVIS